MVNNLNETLIVYGTRYGATPEVCAEIQKILEKEYKIVVEIWNLKDYRACPDLEEFDNIILASGIEHGKWTENTRKFLTKDLRDKNVAVFIGNALLVDEDGRVEADRMEVFLIASEKNENENKEDIEKVIATGNVKITTPERRTKSGKAVFHKKEDILILYDNPEVWQKGTCFTGGRITFDLKKDTMIIDKDVQGSIESSKEKDADITDKKSH